MSGRAVVVPGGRGAGEWLVTEHTVHAAVVGSRAFGLAGEGSDTDTRGVYVAPTPTFWSLRKPPTHVDGPRPEWFSWEVERFCELALRANPNVLEVLYSPLVVVSTPLGDELVALRGAFLSRLVHQAYHGFARGQLRRIDADLRRGDAPRGKQVMHLLRSLIAGAGLLATGELTLDTGPYRERLLAVRRGELPWDRVDRWRRELLGRLDDALATTALPGAPDTDRVDAWLRSVRSRGVGA